jgi:hypothetical protein
MAQDFTRYAVQATNSATTVFTANSNDAVIGIRVANILTSAITISVWISETGSTDRQILDNKNMIIESAVLAGPVTFTNTVTVTGTLVIV